METIYLSNSLEDTKKLALKISEYLFRGAVISLDGDLGAGKTTFTKFLAQGLDIKDEVLSPTFNILRCYFHGKMPLYHIDAYRLEDQINIDIGLEEVIEGDGVSVIEWGKFIPNLVFEPLNIKIQILSDNQRKFIISSEYQKYFLMIEKIEGVK